jgi:membrane-associated protein
VNSFDPASLLSSWGSWAVLGVTVIIFLETSTLVGSFLPGDSLLFSLGLLLASSMNTFPIWLAIPLVFASAVLGAQAGYYVGRLLGPRMFRNEKARLFNPRTLERGRLFFEEYGNRAVIVARFVPIIRALIPAFVGMSLFPPIRFFFLNVIGGALWVAGLMSLGYCLGFIPLVSHNVEWVIIGVVALTSLLMPIELLRGYLKRRRAR